MPLGSAKVRGWRLCIPVDVVPLRESAPEELRNIDLQGLGYALKHVDRRIALGAFDLAQIGLMHVSARAQFLL